MRALLALLAVVLLAVAGAGTARAGDDEGVKGCLQADEAWAAGDDEGPPTFTDDFFRQQFHLDVSTDGFGKRFLAISIEEVCDVPAGYEKQAVQLSGADGVAVITSKTLVYKGRKLLSGRRRHNLLADADTMTLTVKLRRPEKWRQGEDDRVPTFTAKSATITD